MTRPQDENFIQPVITSYAKNAAMLAQYVELLESDKTLVKDRIVKLNSRIAVLRALNLSSIPELQPIIDDYIALHQQDIASNQTQLATFDRELAWVNTSRTSYEKERDFLLANPATYVALSVFTKIGRDWLDNVSPSLDRISAESHATLVQHFKNAVEYDSNYHRIDATLVETLGRLQGNYASHYEAYTPPISQNVDVQTYLDRYLSLQPVTCTIDGNLARATVTCN